MGMITKEQLAAGALGCAFGIIVLVGGNLLLKSLQAHSQVTYTVSNATPFTADGKTSAIYVAKAQSVSSEPATHVAMLVKITGAATLQTISACSPNVGCKVSASPGDTVTVSADSLNKDESLQLTIQATANGPLPTKPQVNVRFDGGTGHEATGRDSVSWFFDIIWPSVSLALSLIVFLVVLVITKRANKFFDSSIGSIKGEIKEVDDRLHEAGQQGFLDPQLVWAYVYNQCGLSERASRALTDPPNLLSPWFEAERLVQWATAEDTNVRVPLAARALNAVTTLGIAGDDTCASIDLSRAKLALALGDSDSASKLVERARGHSPEQVARRLNVDSALERYRSNRPSESIMASNHD